MNKKARGMDRERFRALLDAHGADPRRWPKEARAAMEAFCAQDAGARAILAEAEALEAAIAEAAAPAAAPGLQEAILAAARAEPKGADAPARAHAAANDNAPASRWLAAGMLAASLLFGVWLGLSGALPLLDGLLPGASDPLSEIVRLAAAPDDEGDLP